MEEFLKDLGFVGTSEPGEFYWVLPLVNGSEIQSLVKSKNEAHFKLVYPSGYSYYRHLHDKRSAARLVESLKAVAAIPDEQRPVSYQDYIRARHENRDYVCKEGTIPRSIFHLPWPEQYAYMLGKHAPKRTLKRNALTEAEHRFMRANNG